MIWAHDDPTDWGKNFKRAADELKVNCQLFKDDKSVPDGDKAFVRLDQYKDRRKSSKQMIKRLHQRGVKTLPNLNEAYWYDDKINQLSVLAEYMPETLYITDAQHAYEILDDIDYPFVSKTSEGSASKGVRFIVSRHQAEQEIKDAFGKGLKTSVYDRVQKGYLYWQEFVQDNQNDYRVTICNDIVWALKRFNRDDKPFASGSGKIQPVTQIDENAEKAIRLCLNISKKINTQFMAYDVVFDGEKPRVLEMSSAWVTKPADIPAWDLELNPTDYVLGDMWKKSVELLLKK